MERCYVGFRVCCDVAVQDVMSRCQRSFKCMAACEVLPWPDCRRPSVTITHPTPSEAAKPEEPRKHEAPLPSCPVSTLLTSTPSWTLNMALKSPFRMFVLKDEWHCQLRTCKRSPTSKSEQRDGNFSDACQGPCKP